MRPLKLTIAGFGPYADMQALDFEALGRSGLSPDAKGSVDKRSEQERTQAADCEAAKTALAGAEAAKKEALPELTQRLGKLRNQLSSYDELDEKTKRSTTKKRCWNRKTKI